MAKKKTYLLVIVAVVVVLFVSLIVLAKVLITPERVRETVLPLAEESLGRTVDLENIDISIFSGISLQNMAVHKKDGAGEFVAADKVVLRYSLWALLRLKVEVDEIALVRPRLEIIRNEDGSFNFSDLIAEEEETKSSEKGGGAGSGAAKTGGGAPIDLHISKVSIEDGQLLFIDRSAKPEAKHQISQFNLQANNVSLTEKFPLELSALWNGNDLGLSGQVDAAGMGADVEAFFNQIKVHLAGGVSDDGKVKGRLSLPKTDFEKIYASIPKEYDPGVRDFGIAGNIAFDAAIDDDMASLKQLQTTLNGQTLTMTAEVKNLYDIPTADFKMKGDMINIEKLLPSTAESAEKNGTGKKGKKEQVAKANTEEVGPFDIPVAMTGAIDIGKLLYNGIPINDLAIKISLKKNVFRLDSLMAAFAGGKIQKNATVDLGVKGLKYATAIDIKGIQGGELVKMLKPDLAGSFEGVAGGEMSFSGAGTIPAAAKKKLTGQGTLRLADGKLQSIPTLDSIAVLLGVPELKTVDIDNGDINFTVKDGKVNIDSKFNGDKARMGTSGQVGLDGGLNLRTALALSPELGGELRAQGNLARYLGDENGWTTVPLRIKGNYSDPDVGLDSKGVRKQAEKQVKEELKKKIEEELQDKLKGLFGR